MNQSYVSLRFEQIEIRFNEISLLLKTAENNQLNFELYQALCRSAHVLLVGHFEGLYKEICRDVIDDINSNIKFFQVPKEIMNTHCDFFIQKKEDLKSANSIRIKLKEAFKNYPADIKVDPFLFIDNKNPTPQIIETILERFGVKNFFWSLENSDLSVVFEGTKSKTQKLRDKLLRYVKKNTFYFPYTINRNTYNPNLKEKDNKAKTLWEDFLNNFLKDRHNIIHGHITDTPNDHEALLEAKTKIEIILYAYIINLCSVSNPLIFLPEPKIYFNSENIMNEPETFI